MCCISRGNSEIHVLYVHHLFVFILLVCIYAAMRETCDALRGVLSVCVI